jgi:hypothetical protein
VGRLSDFTTLDIRNLWLRSIQGQRIGRGSNQPLTQADYGQAAQLTDLFLTLLDQSGLAELGFSLKVLI